MLSSVVSFRYWCSGKIEFRNYFAPAVRICDSLCFSIGKLEAREAKASGRSCYWLIWKQLWWIFDARSKVLLKNRRAQKKFNNPFFFVFIDALSIFTKSLCLNWTWKILSYLNINFPLSKWTRNSRFQKNWFIVNHRFFFDRDFLIIPKALQKKIRVKLIGGKSF